MAYNSALAKKVGNGDASAVTSEDMNIELINQGANASGNNPIVVTFEKSQRQYSINGKDGKIAEYTQPNILDLVKIGDYIEYDPTYLDAEKTQMVDSSKLTYTSLTGSATEHGNGYTSTETGGGQKFTAKSGLKWRILNVKADKLEIIPSEMIKKDMDDVNHGYGYFGLSGARGYLYAEQELHEICKIYGYGIGADTSKRFNYVTGDLVEGTETGEITGSGARSINVDDINKMTGYSPTTGSSYTHSIIYPTKTTSTGKSTSATSRTYADTYYSYTGSSYLTSTEEPYKMLFRNTANSSDISYWLTSRCIYVYPDNDIARFGVRCVRSGSLSDYGFLYGYSNDFIEYPYSLGVRPIVYLKSTIQTSGKDSSGAWIIMDN